MGFLFGSSAAYIAIGIACLVISQQNQTPCGLGGSPPLWNWVFGTGIAYLVIGACLSFVAIFLLCSIVLILPWLIVVFSAGGFTFAWTIVGAVSLWQNGGDCVNTNYVLWQMGMAAVILSIIMCVSTIPNYKSVSQEN